jgi:hypothetical protein
MDDSSTLQEGHVRLEPLALCHIDGLVEAANLFPRTKNHSDHDVFSKDR